MFGSDFAPLAAGPQAGRRGLDALVVDRGGKRPELCGCGGAGCVFAGEGGLAGEAPPTLLEPSAEPLRAPNTRFVQRRHALWRAFVEADEIVPTLAVYRRIRRIYRIPKEATALSAFDALIEAADATMTVRVREMTKVRGEQG